jgi:hypothetical protein
LSVTAKDLVGDVKSSMGNDGRNDCKYDDGSNDCIRNDHCRNHYNMRDYCIGYYRINDNCRFEMITPAA